MRTKASGAAAGAGSKSKLPKRNGVLGRMKGTFQRVSFKKRRPKASRPNSVGRGRDGEAIGEDEFDEVRSRGGMHTCRKRGERERERSGIFIFILVLNHVLFFGPFPTSVFPLIYKPPRVRRMCQIKFLVNFCFKKKLI